MQHFLGDLNGPPPQEFSKIHINVRTELFPRSQQASPLEVEESKKCLKGCHAVFVRHLPEALLDLDQDGVHLLPSLSRRGMFNFKDGTTPYLF